LTAVLFFVYVYYYAPPRIAYVRSFQLVYGFNGMKEAHEEYQQQALSWQQNIDTLKTRYEKSKAEIENNKTLTSEAYSEKNAALERMKSELINYSSVIKEKAMQKEKEMTQAVLNQVNSYVEEYAKSNGYDIVFGSEGTGYILYGNEAFDITDKVLKSMNEAYRILPKGEH